MILSRVDSVSLSKEADFYSNANFQAYVVCTVSRTFTEYASTKLYQSQTPCWLDQTTVFR